MELITRNRKLRAAMSSEPECLRQFGRDMCKKLLLRIAALKAAPSLGVFWPPKSGPERCHELIGDQKGVFSMDVKQPYRLLFRPIDEDRSADRSDERERWNHIHTVELLDIKDTHG